MPKVTAVHAREILDSRGNPTIEAEVSLDGVMGRAIVPSGASTGSHEALELRDGDAARYLGKGVLKAVANVNTTIANAVLNKDFATYGDFDAALLALDGTKNKTNLGANAILACSMAFVVAHAKLLNKPLYAYLSQDNNPHILPITLMNIINGGEHADNPLDFQEFMIIPEGAKSLHEAVRMGAEVFHNLKKILKKAGLATGVGDEGGYAPAIASNRQALDTILEAIKAAGYTTDQIKIGLDVAASEFYKDGKYVISGEGKTLTSDEMGQYYLDLIRDYPIVSIEDGFSEDDFTGWSNFQKILDTDPKYAGIRTVGDDLFVTNVDRLKLGIEQRMANSILIKVNQIGSISETIATINLAHANNMHSIISHRSGESEDTFIADLAVAMGSGYIKTGSLSRSDRIAKYNQLIRIEEALGSAAQYGK